jgi:hypothetical protein
VHGLIRDMKQAVLAGQPDIHGRHEFRGAFKSIAKVYAFYD